MRILYAIQGTGNGHLSRARDIVPILKSKCHTDVLISGTQCDIKATFDINYRMNGLGFIFGKSGGVDLLETYRKSNLRNFLHEVKTLSLDKYDLVINDFEPVSAWAASKQKVPCVSLSHQCAVLADKAPRPSMPDPMGLLVLKTYAPTIIKYGFHFKRFDKNIFTPVIRQEVRDLAIETKEHFTVYLPSYEDEKIIKVLSKLSHIRWEVFSKHNPKPIKDKNVWIRPIENRAFIESMASSQGVLCGAGFETPAEALFLKKKLMAIPMKNQYEQQCNAAALKDMGVPVIKSLKKKHIERIEDWAMNSKLVKVDYPNETEKIIDMVLKKHGRL